MREPRTKNKSKGYHRATKKNSGTVSRLPKSPRDGKGARFGLKGLQPPQNGFKGPMREPKHPPPPPKKGKGPILVPGF